MPTKSEDTGSQAHAAESTTGAAGLRAEEFCEAAEAHDVDRLVTLMTEDVVFRSPAVHKPYRGRERVRVLLSAVANVMEDFRYTRKIGDPNADEHALVFRARIGDREVEGCDFIRVGEAGLVDELVVMVRPLSGLLALAEAMKTALELAPSLDTHG